MEGHYNIRKYVFAENFNYHYYILLKVKPSKGNQCLFFSSCFPLNSHQTYLSNMVYLVTVEFGRDINFRARSLVVSDLRLETKGS